jgi:hypothetical protein
LLAFIEGNFCAGIQGIKNAAMHADQIARPLEFAQISAQSGWRDTKQILEFRKAEALLLPHDFSNRVMSFLSEHYRLLLL